MSCDYFVFKVEGSSWSDSKQAQWARTTVIQHCYSDVDILAGCVGVVSVPCSLWILTMSISFDFIAKYITSEDLVLLSFLWDAYWVAPLFFPPYFSSTFILLAVAGIDNLTISFDINSCSEFTFTMLTISFGTSKDFIVFKISLARISYIPSKSLTNIISICIFLVQESFLLKTDILVILAIKFAQ